MSNNQAVSDVYRVIGLLEGMTMMQGMTVTEGMVTVLAECVDRLEVLGAQLLAKDVSNDEKPDGCKISPEQIRRYCGFYE